MIRPVRAGRLSRELGLQVRMLAALVLAGTLLLAAIAALIWVSLEVPSGWLLVAAFVLATVTGAVSLLGSATLPRAAPDEGERLTRAVGRLAVVADVGPPGCVVVANRVPLSWTFAMPGGERTVHVTTGMLDRLSDRELEAVAAHELAHLLHRDAVVMTLVAGPPAAVLAGLRSMLHGSGKGPIVALYLYVVLGPPAVMLMLVSRIVSRHRELAADRAAALLVGSPAAVAAALAAVDDGLAGQRTRDLRRAHRRDAFHFVPACEARRIARLWATHPRTHRRIERMERLEERLQR